jgi:hypothetical protein
LRRFRFLVLGHKTDGTNHQEKSLLGEITMGYENVHGIADFPEQAANKIGNP